MVVAPNFLEQALTAEDLARMAEEVLQKIELLGGELDGFPAAGHFMRAHADFDIPECVTLLLLGSATGAAQDGLDARQQLADGKRLGDIIVGAELEADDFVDLLAARGQPC